MWTTGVRQDIERLHVVGGGCRVAMETAALLSKKMRDGLLA